MVGLTCHILFNHFRYINFTSSRKNKFETKLTNFLGDYITTDLAMCCVFNWTNESWVNAQFKPIIDTDTSKMIHFCTES